MLQHTFAPLNRPKQKKKPRNDLALILLLGFFVVFVLAVVGMLQP